MRRAELGAELQSDVGEGGLWAYEARDGVGETGGVDWYGRGGGIERSEYVREVEERREGVPSCEKVGGLEDEREANDGAGNGSSMLEWITGTGMRVGRRARGDELAESVVVEGVAAITLTTCACGSGVWGVGRVIASS